MNQKQTYQLIARPLSLKQKNNFEYCRIKLNFIREVRPIAKDQQIMSSWLYMPRVN